MFIKLTSHNLVKLESIFKIVVNGHGRFLHLTDGTTIPLTYEDIDLIVEILKKHNLLAYSTNDENKDNS